MADKAELVAVIVAKDQASGTIGNIGNKVDGMSDSFKKAGIAATVAGAAMVAVLTKMATVAADFEKGMREVNTMIGLSEAEFSAFSEQIKDLSSTMGVDAVEATAALYQAISAGVPKENAIEFLTVATKAAIGGVTDMETAVDGLTTVINAFRMPISDAQRVADVMFTTVKGGKTTFDQLSASMFNVAPIAAAAGIKFEEVAAALATMTKQGVPTSVATTQLRQAMVMLQKPTTEMSAVVKSLGFSSAETMLSELGLAETLNRLRDATGGSNEKLMTMFSSVEAGAAVLALTGSNAQMFAQDLAAMDEATNGVGAATEAYNEMNKSTSRQIDQLKSQFQELMITLGENILPVIVAFAEKIGDVVGWVVEWLDKHPALTEALTNFGLVLTGLVVAGGPMLLLIGYIPQIIAGFKVMVTFFRSTLIPAVVRVIAAFIAMMASMGPKGWAIIAGGIAAATAGILAMSKLLGEEMGNLEGLSPSDLNALAEAYGMPARLNLEKFPEGGTGSTGGAGGGGGGGEGGSVQDLIDKAKESLGMQRGGIVRSPTLALLAENYKPEAVVPLSGSGGGRVVEYNPTLIFQMGSYMGDEISRRKLAQDVLELIREDQRRTTGVSA